MKKSILFTPAIILVTFLVAIAATTIDDFFLPGSQVGQSGNIETPDRCDNCHGGYDAAVEPAFNWRGSMMAQAARDPLFYACLAIANQDAPDVGDLCLRCHTPDGWLNGRCEPTDGSLLNNNDRQGVQCDFCHKLVTPLQKDGNGNYINPYSADTKYTTSVYGTVTYIQDQTYLNKLTHIPNGSANGMYIADDNNAKRGPYADATGRHQMTYSPFHKEAALCGTCHDVSNPAFTRTSTTDTEYAYNAEGMMSETFNLRLMFPVERTYSEWLASSYNASGGKSCQDCHMKDVTGKGAKMKDAPTRTNLPLHDFTGGNTFVPLMVKDKWAAEVNGAALDAGIERSRQQLKAAAEVTVELNTDKTLATVKIVNKTGHKLPTGYPEGRRMWINVKFYNASNALIGESGKYDPATAELAKTGTKIYECKPGFSTEWAATLGKPAAPSFNFAINNFVWFDNRIPPAGSTYDGLLANQSPFVEKGGIMRTGNSTTDIHTDLTSYAVPANTTKIEVRLMYQTTSKEYVEFLRDNNHTNSAGQELYDLWAKHGKSAPEIMNEVILNIGTTPPPAELTYMDASFVLVTKKTSKKQATGYAEVKVVKTGTTTPIAGATVYADYTGPSAGSTSAITDASGIAKLSTKAVNNPLVVWCFRVLDVVKEADAASPGGYEYIIPKPLLGACDPYPVTATLKNAIIPESMASETSLTVYPNPSNGKAWIGYSLAEAGQTRLAVFSSTGQQVSVITDKFLDAGEHTAKWDGAGFPNGVYYFRLSSNTDVITRPLILNK